MADEVTRLGVAELVSAYRSRALSPVDVTRAFLDRIGHADGALHAFVTVTPELAMRQAADAERCYATAEPVGALAGVPVSVKDAFHVEGVATTLGSLVHRDHIAKNDSGVVRRLRASGAVFTGKTNTAEFGQSATTDNLLGPDTANPWDPVRTPGGSSGGAAASVAAGLSTLAVGSDGGGSIRIPAAFCGTYGLKPTPGACPDEKGFRGMTDFVSPGPLTRAVADARVLLGVLADREFARRTRTGLRVAYCARPEGRPVDPGVSAAVGQAAQALAALGHDVVETDLPLHGWNDVFGPLVLDDEHRERGHLLTHLADSLTRYERSSLRAALALDPKAVQQASAELPRYRQRVTELFDSYDVLVTPTVAVAAFLLGERPSHVDGVTVDHLWGAFPFAVPFNVAGVPAASVPCGFADGLPVGAQLIVRKDAEDLLLDISQDLEEALSLNLRPAHDRWTPQQATTA